MTNTTAKSNFNIYEAITDRIISQLEKGTIPWKKEWCLPNISGKIDLTRVAFNRTTKKPYSLLNQMLLGGKTGEWATYKQWTSLGGKIRKGEKSSMVVFWKLTPIKEKQDDGTVKTKTIPLLRYYNVFHISQVENVEPLKNITSPITLIKGVEAFDEAEKIKNTYMERENMEIHEIETNEAFYSPMGDYVQVPCRKQYKKQNAFYSTLFHEMTHSTGHTSRLNRLDSKARFGNEVYSKEELVAEIGACTLLNMLGLETDNSFNNSVAYIESWLQVLRNDKKFIVSATSKAEKAVNYILTGEKPKTYGE